MYKATVIKRCHSGFNMWEAGEYGEGWDDENDLVNEIYQNIHEEIFELGVDELPEGMEDIRGRINGEPDRVFGYMADCGGGTEEPCYVGISKV
jgi:hypothetical protein